MKKIIFIIVLLAFVVVSNSSFAQLTKDEKKEWKNRAKEYKKNPELLKELVEEKQAAEAQVNQLKTEVNDLQSRLADKDAKISELQDDLTGMRAEVASSKAKLADLQKEPQGQIGVGGMSTDGVVFKVQIGAFRNKDLSKYFEQHENFGGEMSEKGEQRITLGRFRDYWEADVFKKYLREMGVKDAWIVPYKDNQRVPLKDVLEGVISSDSKGTE
ncbi:MAG: Ezrin/radixin/moesin family protein [Candidatus Cyclobacteriaceae bacterium M2_1C_046]